MRLIYFLGIFFTSLTLSASNLVSSKIIMEMTFKKDVMIYQRANSSEEGLAMTSSRSVSDLKITGDGIFAFLNIEMNNLVDTAVPGVDYSGHDHLNFKKGDDDHLYISRERLTDDGKGGTSLWKYHVPVKFIKRFLGRL